MRAWKAKAMMALMCGTFATPAFAQGNQGAPAAGANQPPAVAPMKVGVIDMGYILDHHPTMTKELEAVDAQIKAAEDEINARKDAMIKEYDSLKQFNDSSPEYRKKEEEINKMQSQLTLEFNRKDKEFAEKKARIVFEAYKQAEEAAKLHATHYQFGMLVRYNRKDTEMDPKKPNTVQMGILKSVVYFDPSLDLTEPVVGYLAKLVPAAPTNGAAQPRAASNPAGAQPQQRR